MTDQTSKRKNQDTETSEDNGSKLLKTFPAIANVNKKTVDEELLLVYDTVDLGKRAQRQLSTIGITTVDDLLSKRTELEEAGLESVSKNAQKQLLLFCLWREHFDANNISRGVKWQESFSEDSLEDFEVELTSRSPCHSAEEKIESLFDHAVKMLHVGGQGELSNLPQEKVEGLYKHVAKLTIKKLPADLLSHCQFDVKSFACKCAKAIFNLPTGEPYPSIQLVAGRTQSGKSDVKAVVAAVCELVYCPLIVITKGVAESKDLQKKIKSLLTGKSCPFKAWCGKIRDNKGMWVIPDTAAQIKKASKLINELRDENTPHGKFVVIVDECDAMYRTEDGDQLMEKAYDELMGLGPAFRIEISATPVPAFLVLSAKLGLKMDRMLRLGTSKDYSGITEMKHLKDDDGKGIFMDAKTPRPDQCVQYKEHHPNPNGGTTTLYEKLEIARGASAAEIKKRYFRLSKQYRPDKGGDEEKFKEISAAYEILSNQEQRKKYDAYDDMLLKYDEKPLFPDAPDGIENSTTSFAPKHETKLGFIPGTDDSAMKLYDHALSTPGQDELAKQGVLLLDCTVNKVRAELNVFQKAARVQSFYFRKGKPMVVVVVVGEGIFIRRPGFVHGRYVKNRMDVSDVLESLDGEVGLGMPIFVFGYSKMKRCISYRSDKRVPTHMVLSLGFGHSNENYIQAIGRATYNGLACLKANGHEHVTVLTTEHDLVMARKYMNFVEEIGERLDRGDSQEDIMSGDQEKFKAASNFLLHTNRKTGMIKGLKSRLPSQCAFEEPLDFEDDFTSQKYDEDKLATRVMKAIVDLALDDNKTRCKTNDIMNKYNDTYQEGGVEGVHTIKPSLLRKILTTLKNDTLLEKEGDYYAAKNLKRLRATIRNELL